MKTKHKIVLLVCFLVMVFFIGVLPNDNNWEKPEGKFLSVSIEQLDMRGNVEYVWFKVPDERLAEFETKFRECIGKADRKNKMQMWKDLLLKIKTEKGNYDVFIFWTADRVYFENGFSSKEFRMVLYEFGFEGGR